MYATNSGNSNVLSHCLSRKERSGKMGLRSYVPISIGISNHLGNVLSVISDKVIPHASGGSVAYYKADILQAMDYSPFGVKLKGRNLNKTGNTELYRSGFQGQEEDDELKGDGNTVSFAYRIHDPRLGRFFSTDPLVKKYPHNSTYAFCENMVISYRELEGAEKWDAVIYKGTNGVVLKTIYRLHTGPAVDGMRAGIGIYYAVYKGNTLVSETKENDFSTFHAPNTDQSLFNQAMYRSDLSGALIVGESGSYRGKDNTFLDVVRGQAISAEKAIYYQVPILGEPLTLKQFTKVWEPTKYYFYFENDISDKFATGEGLEYGSQRNINYGLTNQESIDEIATILIQNPGQTIQVEGHTSSPEPNPTHNEKLSAARAKFVRDAIVARAKELDPNFDGARVTSKGYAFEQPVVAKDNEDGMTQEQKDKAQSLNRRTVVKLVHNATPPPTE